jgi:hypothetical protein
MTRDELDSRAGDEIVSGEQMVAALKREIAMRLAVYPRRVAVGQMKEADAIRETACMREVLVVVERAFNGIHSKPTASPAWPLPPDPAPAGEVVELAVWRTPRGEVFHHVAGSVADCKNPETWTRLGTVRLPLTEDV